jgi:hypothetical protein
MQATTNDDRKHAGFAVNRSYQPTRIERELLAQVFELAAHGTTSQSDANEGQQPRDRSSHRGFEHESATLPTINYGDVQDEQRERAA